VLALDREQHAIVGAADEDRAVVCPVDRDEIRQEMDRAVKRRDVGRVPVSMDVIVRDTVIRSV